MTLLGPQVVRSRMLHALAERPLLTTREVVDAVGVVPFAYTSFLYRGDCDVCRPIGGHTDYHTPSINWYSTRNDAGRILATLARSGLVVRMGDHRFASWRLGTDAERPAVSRDR